MERRSASGKDPSDLRLPPLRLIVGLGNPGPAYERTRHNAGFMVVDRLSDQWGGRFRHILRKSLTSTAGPGENRLILAKPQTYMNRSGEAVRELVEHYQVSPAELLAVYDEVALPLGKLRLRRGGSSGGHKGMKSIIACLGSQDFPRLRIGIAPPEPPRDLSAFVLQEFAKRERAEFEDALEAACQAVEAAIREGLEAAMARFN